MEKVLVVVEFGQTDGKEESFGRVSLPAMPDELEETLNRICLADHAEQEVEIRLFVKEYAPEVEFLLEHLCDGIRDIPTLFLFNALTRRVAHMDGLRLCAFEGLVRMETAQMPRSVSVKRLCELTAEVDGCHVISGISDDASLGRFYVRCGFLPEYAGLPETVLTHLDYQRIGREQRERNGGAFLSHGGYVLRKAGITKVCKDFTPREMERITAEDFAVVLEWPVPPPNLQGARKTGGLPDGPDMLLYCGEGSLPCLCVVPEEILRMADGGGFSRKDAMPLREGLVTALKMAAANHDGRHPVFVRQVAM